MIGYPTRDHNKGNVSPSLIPCVFTPFTGQGLGDFRTITIGRGAGSEGGPLVFGESASRGPGVRRGHIFLILRVPVVLRYMVGVFPCPVPTG